MKAAKKLVLTPLKSKKTGKYLFLCCFISYVLVYLARYNLTAALPSITDAQTGILPADKAGLIGTSLLVAYGIGQFVNGFIAERFPPFGLIGFSMFLSAASNLAMYAAVTYMTPTLPIMMAIWAVNGYSQSFIWPTFMRTLALVLPEEQRISAGANMLMSTAFGFITANTVSSLILQLTGKWQPLFLTASVVVGGSALVWLMATHGITSKVYAYAEPEPAAAKDLSANRNGMALLPLLAVSGVFVILIPSVGFALVKEGIQSWVPTMVKETFGMSPAFSVAVSTVIPVISIPGAAIAKLIMQKLLHDEMKTTALLMALSTVILAVVGTFTLGSLIPTLVLLAVVITLLLGVNTMTVSLVPIRFARHGKTATVTGIINSVCAAGGGFSQYLTGLVKINFGWQVTLYVMAGVTFAGLIASLLVIRRWMKFKQL